MEQEFVKSELYSHLSQGISFPKGQILLAAAIALKKTKKQNLPKFLVATVSNRHKRWSYFPAKC